MSRSTLPFLPYYYFFFPLSMSLCFRFRSMLPKTLIPEHEAKGAERQNFRCSRRAIGNEEIHYRGVRKRPFGRFAAKIQDPRKKTRVWFKHFRLRGGCIPRPRLIFRRHLRRFCWPCRFSNRVNIRFKMRIIITSISLRSQPRAVAAPWSLLVERRRLRV